MRCHPVFLVGAGRSGTTLLYKILCLHADVAYISNYHTKAPGWFPAGLLLRLVAPFPTLKRIAWFEQSGNANSQGKRPWLRRIVPGPVEGESLYSGCGLTAAPAQDSRLSQDTINCFRRKLERVAEFSGAKVILSKRTANNQRLSLLREIVPEARFIHLIRDGRAVAYSLPKVRWWDRHRIWWAGCSPQKLVGAGEDPLAISARNWVKDIHAVQSGLAGLPVKRVLELRYEELMADPVRQVRRVTDFLGLNFTPRFEAVLRSLDLKQRPAAWKKNWEEGQLETVTREQHSLLRDLGYV